MAEREHLLLTGATGYLGRWLLPRLIERYKVTCLVRRPETAFELPGEAAAVVGDLGDPQIGQHLPAGVDVILHLAVEPPSGHHSAFRQFQVNALGSLSLLEYARQVGVRRFVFTSSGSVYRQQPAPIGEDVVPQPESLLGIAKYAVELLLATHAAYFDPIVLRPFHLYGPGQPEQFLIPRLMGRVGQGQAITILAGQKPVLSHCYIGDAVELVLAALRLRGPVTLNLASPIPHSIYDICELIGELLGRTPNYVFSPRPAENLVADTTRMQALLGFTPPVTLREGLRRCLAARGAGVAAG